MIVFLDQNGNVITSSTDRIGRNSNDASIIYVVGYIPAEATVYMTFTLPNGKTLFGGLAGQASGDDTPQEATYLLSLEGVSAWRYVVPSSVTALSGVVDYDIYAQTESMRFSAHGTFTVAKGNPIVSPSDHPSDVWDEISVKLSSLEASLEAFSGFVGYEDGESYTKTLSQRIQDLENEIGESENDFTQNIAQAKAEAIAAAEAYADAPQGTVAQGVTLPVSGGAVFDAIQASGGGGDTDFTQAIAQAKAEAIAAAEAYADAPTGTVAQGVTLPVSGGAVFDAIQASGGGGGTDFTQDIAQAKAEAIAAAEAYADAPTGTVAQGVTLPVSGGAVFDAINPIDSRLTALEDFISEVPFFLTETNLGTALVPSGASEYASIDEIGGHTRKCKNIFKLPQDFNYSFEDTETGSIVTISANENGYLVINTNGIHVSTGRNTTFSADDMLTSFPSNVTISAKYISGNVTSVILSSMFSIFGLQLEGLPSVHGQTASATYQDQQFPDTVYLRGAFTNYTIALMIEEGTTASPYEPYFEGVKSADITSIKSYKADGTLLAEFPIPSKIREQTGYGVGVDANYKNVVSFENKFFKRTTSIGKVSADWTWNTNSALLGQYYATHTYDGGAPYGLANCYCNNFKGSPRGAYDGTGDSSNDNSISIAGTRTWIYSTRFSTSNDLISFLAENETFVAYILSGTELITNLSEPYFSNAYIQVEPGGRIEAYSDYGIPAYVTLTYQIHTQGGSQQ